MIAIVVSVSSFAVDCQEVVIEDFESWSLGNIPNPPWRSTSCGPHVTTNNRGGKNLHASSCYWGQWVKRKYNFSFTTEMTHSYVQFSSRITSVSGNTGTIVKIFGSNGDHIYFGQKEYVPKITRSNDKTDASSIRLESGIWYQFRLYVNFTYANSIGHGMADFYYRKIDEFEWTKIKDLSGLELEIIDPTKLNVIQIRTDTLSHTGGEVDDVIVRYYNYDEITTSTLTNTHHVTSSTSPILIASGNSDRYPDYSLSNVFTLNPSLIQFVTLRICTKI